MSEAHASMTPFALITRRVAGVAGILVAVAACERSTGPILIVEEPNRLAVGTWTNCGLAGGGGTHCWGHSTMFWEFGEGKGSATSHSISAPSAISVWPLAALSPGNSQHTCGITADGAGICWGRGTYGQLGGGALGETGNAPTVVHGGITWKEIVTGRLGTCGVSTAGDGYCWGANQRGEIGNDSIPLGQRTGVPVRVAGGLKFSTIAAGWLHSCGLDADGRAYCWGSNLSGQLGIGFMDTLARRQPVPVSGNLRYTQLSMGGQHTCGIATNQRAYCWGWNGTGQLGDGTTEARTVPTAVAGGLRFARIRTSFGGEGAFVDVPQTGRQAGVGHTCALTPQGRAYCWGWNGAGQLGDGTTDDRLTPVPVSNAPEMTSIGVGGSHSCGMRGNTVWCWGSHQFGQAGIGFGDFAPWPHVLTPHRVLPPFASP